jgi:hypothetical protein
MNQTREFEIHGGGFHSLTIDDSHIKIESYTLGSLAGGTGTESSYAIDLTRRADFFKDMGISHGEELFQRLDTYTEIDWNNLRSMIQKYQTGSFVWMETDWSDSIKIQITLTGETKVGETLTVAATATSTEGTFDVMYEWYRGDSIDDPFRIIESARFETYTLIEADRGKYIRCGVSSRDNTGINSSFKPSETIGPIK